MTASSPSKTLLVTARAAALCAVIAGTLSCRDAPVDPPKAEPPAPAPAAAESDDRREPLGNLTIPDVVLTNQDGAQVHLPELLQGKRVAMSFVFTRCTTVCPLIGFCFSRLQKELGARAGGDVRLVSITLDPAYDTPERLREWSQRHDAGKGWTLLTGSQEDIDRVLRAMTVYTPAKEQHAPIVLLGNAATGEWVRAYGLSAPKSLIATLDGLGTPRGAGG